MRLFKFLKIDIIRIKRMAWVLLFPVLAAFIIVKDADSTNSLFAFLYCLLGGIVLASFPLSGECAGESGFLKMLPSKKGDSLRGHFLFALLTMLLFAFLGIGAIWVSHLINPAIAFGLSPIYPLVLGIGLLVSALENVLLCAFHFDNQQAQGVLRMVPAFVFFFGGLMVYSQFPESVAKFAAWITLTKSLVILLICLLLFWAIAEICAFFFSRRDEV